MADPEDALRVALVPTDHIASTTEVAPHEAEASAVGVEDLTTAAAEVMMAAPLPMIKVHHKEIWEGTTATTLVLRKTIIIKMVATAGGCMASIAPQTQLAVMIRTLGTMKVRSEVVL